MSEDVDYWSVEDAEILRHTALVDAVSEWWDDLPAVPAEGGELGVRVRQYRRMRPTSCGSPLEAVMELLDEEYGDPYGDRKQSAAAMQRMQEAERAFIAAVLEAYEPWTCEEIGTVQVRVRVLPEEGYEIISVDGRVLLPPQHPEPDDEATE